MDLNGTAVHTATDSADVRARPGRVGRPGKEKRRREWLELGHMPKERDVEVVRPESREGEA